MDMKMITVLSASFVSRCQVDSPISRLEAGQAASRNDVLLLQLETLEQPVTEHHASGVCQVFSKPTCIQLRRMSWCRLHIA